MNLDRFKNLEDKLYTLMEKAIDKLTDRIEGDCTAADLQAAIAMLKNNKIDLERASSKGEDPDLPDEDDLPFTESDLVSMQ